MYSKSTQISVPLAFLLAVTLPLGVAFAQQFPGAIQTTDKTGTAVNTNTYGMSTDVYLSGGPQNQNAAGLPNGTYYFQVTNPNGATLLSTDNAVCRQLKVVGGKVAGATGPCAHANGTFNPANGTTPVQVGPFSVTPNNGGVYKVWLIPTGKATISGTDPKVLNFSNSNAKTDNFKVQSVTPPVGSCLPTSSLSVLIAGSNVTAYIPNGSWAETGTGVKHTCVEGAACSPTTIPTVDTVNSCASNSLTGQTVCTSNGTDVYLITGTTMNSTLTSGATGSQGFSGGSCRTCGVAIDPSTGPMGSAVLTIGVAGSPGGFQFLDLATSTMATPISAQAITSEDILIDPVRHLVLSPNEQTNYQIMQFPPAAATPTLFDNQVAPAFSKEFDSAAEDCTTGIALATVEFTNQLFISDLTQATFTPGSPKGTWTSPGSAILTIPEFNTLSAGTSGIAVATPSHYAIVTGEFGGADFGVIQLPASSGSGVPALVDWARATIPNDPSGASWSNGLDPHTVTAYVSPNDGKAYGLMSNFSRTYLAKIDLACIITASAGTHIAASPASCITFIAQ